MEAEGDVNYPNNGSTVQLWSAESNRGGRYLHVDTSVILERENGMPSAYAVDFSGRTAEELTLFRFYTIQDDPHEVNEGQRVLLGMPCNRIYSGDDNCIFLLVAWPEATQGRDNNKVHRGIAAKKLKYLQEDESDPPRPDLSGLAKPEAGTFKVLPMRLDTTFLVRDYVINDGHESREEEKFRYWTSNEDGWIERTGKQCDLDERYINPGMKFNIIEHEEQQAPQTPVKVGLQGDVFFRRETFLQRFRGSVVRWFSCARIRVS
ncbi:uncharacterized protein [Ptychodera flava]|uniref:uncharacterized protein n=1 Tax=Ptychodera flava TaxID=63121 RepID=UPI00396A7B74